MRKYIFHLIVILMFITSISNGQVRLKVTGDPIFSSATLSLTEAGSDYSSSVTSTSAPIINVTHQTGWGRKQGNFDWRLAINKSDINWHPSLEIQVHRTGDGTGGSSFNNWISGGTNFQTVTDIPNTFFEGGAVRNDVPIQFRINNISVLVPADDYETTIYFTVYQQ